MKVDEELEESIITAIAEACGSRSVPIDRDTDLLALGIDSLGLTAVTAHIQSKCGIQISPPDLTEIMQARVVGDVIEAIVRASSVSAE